MGFNLPGRDCIKLTATCTHQGKFAPAGAVFFICTLKYGDSVISSKTLINRSGMPVAIEDKIKEKLKNDFYEAFIKRYSYHLQ